VRLPWVHHRSRAWEPEPLRWIAASTVEVMMGHADTVDSAKAPGALEASLDKLEETLGW